MPARKSTATPKRTAGNAVALASLRVPSAVRGSALSRAAATGRSIRRRASADAGRASGNAPTGRASPGINAAKAKSSVLTACAFRQTSAVLARNAAVMARAFLRQSAAGTTSRRVATGAIGWSASTARCNASLLHSDGRARCEGAMTARAAMASARRKPSSAPTTRIDFSTRRPARAHARAAGSTFRVKQPPLLPCRVPVARQHREVLAARRRRVGLRDRVPQMHPTRSAQSVRVLPGLTGDAPAREDVVESIPRRLPGPSPERERGLADQHGTVKPEEAPGAQSSKGHME